MATNETDIPSLESIKSLIFRLNQEKSEENLMKLIALMDIPFFEVKTIVKQAIKGYSSQTYLKSVILSKLDSLDPLFSTDFYDLAFDILERSAIASRVIDSLMTALPIASVFGRRSIYKILMKIHGVDVCAFFHKELERNIEDPDVSVIRFLGQVKHSASFLFIFKLLDHQNISVVEASLDALLNYNNEIIIPKLIEMLLSFKSLLLMRKILRILSHFTTDEIFLAVVKCLFILELHEDVSSILVNKYGEYVSGTTALEIYRNLHPDLKKEILEFVFHYFESKTSTITQEETIILHSIISFIGLTKDPIYIKYMSNFLCSDNKIIAMASQKYFFEICSDARTAKCINMHIALLEDPFRILNQFEDYQHTLDNLFITTNHEQINVSFSEWMKTLIFLAKISFFRLFTIRIYDPETTILIRILDFLASFKSKYIDNFILHHYIRLLCVCDSDMQSRIHDIMIPLLHKNGILPDAVNFEQIMIGLSDFHIDSILKLLQYLSMSKNIKNKNFLYIYSSILKRNKQDHFPEIISWYFENKYSIIDIFENLKVPYSMRKIMIIEILQLYKKSTNNEFKQMVKSNLSVLSAPFKPTLLYNPLFEKIPGFTIQELLVYYTKAELHELPLLNQIISYYDFSEAKLRAIIKDLIAQNLGLSINESDFDELFQYLTQTSEEISLPTAGESEILI